jgi:hypothetical protein
MPRSEATGVDLDCCHIQILAFYECALQQSCWTPHTFMRILYEIVLSVGTYKNDEVIL